MKILFAAFLVVHGLIHLMGTAKAFGVAEIYREFGSHRVMARGEGIWHAPAGAYSYVRFDIDAIE